MVAKCVPVTVIVHTIKEELEPLKHQLTDLYTDYIITTICRLDCPAEQKIELLDKVIETMGEKG